MMRMNTLKFADPRETSSRWKLCVSVVLLNAWPMACGAASSTGKTRDDGAANAGTRDAGMPAVGENVSPASAAPASADGGRGGADSTGDASDSNATRGAAARRDGGVAGGGGVNSSGQDMEPTCAVSLSAAGHAHCAAYQDGSVWCWGTEGDVEESPSRAVGAPIRVEGVSDALRVVVGPGHRCAETTQGLVCWGKNDALQVDESGISPLGPTEPELSWDEASPAISLGLGATQTCLANSLGHVYCRGLDFNGLHLDSEQIGSLGNAPGTQLLTADYALALEGGVVYSLHDWRAPSLVDFYGSDNVFVAPGAPSCAVKSDGSLWCEDAPFVDPGKLERRAALDEAVLWVGSGDFFACALSVSGRVWCEGWNIVGQLGRGSIDESIEPLAGDWVEGLEDVEALSVNRFSVCALSSDRSIACWGAYIPNQHYSRPTLVSGCED